MSCSRSIRVLRKNGKKDQFLKEAANPNFQSVFFQKKCGRMSVFYEKIVKFCW